MGHRVTITNAEAVALAQELVAVTGRAGAWPDAAGSASRRCGRGGEHPAGPFEGNDLIRTDITPALS